MKDFFGNELKVGQQVMFCQSINRHGVIAMRTGRIENLVKKQADFSNFYSEHVEIKSDISGRIISRNPKDIIGNLGVEDDNN